MTAPRLPDVLGPGLVAVICGTAAGARSAARGAYYAGPGNQFWGVLARTGLTPAPLAPAAFATLPRYGLGLTDVAQATAGADRVALRGHTGARAEAARAALLARLAAAEPRLVAFNGKRAAALVLGRPVTYGPQPERLAGAAVWVLPSTSGAARGAWDETVWRRFARAVRRRRATPSSRRSPPSPR